MFGSVRHQITVDRSASDVWELVGDPARLHEWFPGIVACEVDGDRRTITTATGIDMPEVILVNDPVQRRFQYRVDIPIIAFHRGTIDVLALEGDRCLVTYATDADPRTMALTVGGGTRGALAELKRKMEVA